MVFCSTTSQRCFTSGKQSVQIGEKNIKQLIPKFQQIRNTMSYRRTSIFEFNSEKDADEGSADYQKNLAFEFLEGEILLAFRTERTSAVAVSVYLDGETVNNTTVTSKARMYKSAHWRKSSQIIPLQLMLFSDDLILP